MKEITWWEGITKEPAPNSEAFQHLGLSENKESSKEWPGRTEGKWAEWSILESKTERLSRTEWSDAPERSIKMRTEILLLGVKTRKSLVILMCKLSGWRQKACFLDQDEEKTGGDAREAETIDNFFKKFCCEGGGKWGSGEQNVKIF